LKIFDFGLAKEQKDSIHKGDGRYEMTGNTGSRRYMAPGKSDGRMTPQSHPPFLTHTIQPKQIRRGCKGLPLQRVSGCVFLWYPAVGDVCGRKTLLRF
jgi:hypothetical protein